MSRSNVIRLSIISVLTMVSVAISTLVMSKVDLEPHNQWHMEVWEITHSLTADNETVNTTEPHWECVQSNLVNIFDAYDGMLETQYIICPLKHNQICKVYNLSADTLWVGKLDGNEGVSEATLAQVILPGERSVIALGRFTIWPKNKMAEWETVPWVINTHR